MKRRLQSWAGRLRLIRFSGALVDDSTGVRMVGSFACTASSGMTHSSFSMSCSQQIMVTHWCHHDVQIQLKEQHYNLHK